MFPYVRFLLFVLFVVLLYVFWEWNGAEFLIKSVQPPVSVSAIAVGKPAPDVVVGTKQIWSRQEFRLSSLRGYPILLHFWATWCGPCVQELPELLALAKKIRAEGFSVVAVAVDENWEKLELFFKQHPSLRALQNETILLLDPSGEIAARFGSSRFPESFLINDRFLIDNKLVGAQPWNQPQMQPYLQRLRSQATGNSRDGIHPER